MMTAKGKKCKKESQLHWPAKKPGRSAPRHVQPSSLTLTRVSTLHQGKESKVTTGEDHVKYRIRLPGKIFQTENKSF
jgi:hypothetical protein